MNWTTTRTKIVSIPAFLVLAAACGTHAASEGTSDMIGTPFAGAASSEVAPEDRLATPPPASTSASAMASSPSRGCGTAANGIGAVTKKQTSAGGKAREYHVSLTADYKQDALHSLVFVLHGAGDTAPVNMQAWFPIESKMATAPIAVYPQALARTRDDGTGGSVPRWDYTGPDDLAFFDTMLDELGASLCFDRTNVFTTGFSSGGNFSQQLACKRQSLFRAFAAVAGPGPFTAECDGPIAAWMTHDVGDEALSIDKAHDSRAFWQNKNGCSGVWEQDDRAECQRDVSCPSDHPLVYCETTGVGHDVPPFATESIARFFGSLEE